MAKTILVVEDDQNISELLRLYLEKEGYTVNIADDGGKGVELYRRLKPDLVLLDLMLPVLDGWGVLRAIRQDGKTWLGTAKDPVKDQTDFLAQIDYLQVSKLMFPIGGLMKQEVREIASRAGLPSARRKDSQGICFLGKINYNDFVRRFLGEREGAIIELETGKKVGTHRGYWFHTIGQRKGLGLSGGPWFVIKKDVEENIIYVSHGYGVETQFGSEFRINDFHFITENPWKDAGKEIDITFKIRHTPEFTKGKLVQEEGGQFRILSSEKLQGIAPGQFGVIYDEEAGICVGSGEITR
mgnify:CR=1 FL=1